MHYIIELSGCSERKGLVQVRYALYLDPGDYGYEKHYVQVPVIPPEGYTGKDDVHERRKWLDSLPKQWINNPFHNHFVQFEPTATDAEIKYVGDLALQLAAEKWDKDETPNIKNLPVRFPVEKNIALCSARLASLSEVK